jgi:hypothetical protein
MAMSHSHARRLQHRGRFSGSATRSVTRLRIAVFRMIAGTLILGVFTAPSWADQCHSALRGSYEFEAFGLGVDARGQHTSTEVTLTGVMSFMPGGSVTRLFSIRSGDDSEVVKASDPGSSGTWTQNDSDCSGTISFSNASVGPESYRIFFSQDGTKACFVNTATGVVLSGHMQRTGHVNGPRTVSSSVRQRPA